MHTYLTYGLIVAVPLALVGLVGYWQNKNRLLLAVRTALVEHPQLVASFGSPVKISGKPNGRIEPDTALFTLDLSGPNKHKGVVSVHAVRDTTKGATQKIANRNKVPLHVTYHHHH